MAETSKFAGLADLKNPIPEKQTPNGFILPKKEKPVGKREDPAWKQYSTLLKKASHDEAVALLRGKYEGTDFSMLMQALLEQWLKTA